MWITSRPPLFYFSSLFFFLQSICAICTFVYMSDNFDNNKQLELWYLFHFFNKKDHILSNVVTLLKYSSYTNDMFICPFCSCNTLSSVCSMNNLSITNINTYMAAIAYDVTWLCFCHRYTISLASHSRRTMWKTYTKSFVYTHYKTRTVCTIC